MALDKTNIIKYIKLMKYILPIYCLYKYNKQIMGMKKYIKFQYFLGIFVSLEFIAYLHYLYYKRLMSKKKYYDITFDYEFTKNNLLQMSSTELIDFIKNTITQDKRYLKPIPIEKIPRKTMLKWIISVIYLKYIKIKELDTVKLNESHELLTKIEDKLNIQFENKNDNKNIYVLNYGINDLVSIYKPILFYSISYIIKNMFYQILLRNNFKIHICKKSGIKTVYKLSIEKKKTVVFFHGLGYGPVPYITHILNLSAEYNVIVPIFPNISNIEFAENWPEANMWREWFKNMIDEIVSDRKDINIISHSFGTFIAGTLINDEKINLMINKRIFIEPVCLYEKYYKINGYIYDPGKGSSYLMDLAMRWLIYSDIHVTHICLRELYGPNYWIYNYKTMDKDKNLFVFSRKDQIIPIEISNKIIENNIKCLIIDDVYHGYLYFDEKYKTTLENIYDFIKKDL
ncbi:MAG: alpha/beta hydrolase fold [Edafosvirus sp.]|uniref:Alpha/beta hydrolase fold n=1 Tax=Edafosvirus sp. TaxID=2487765 RepID=A0A3G4ZTW8_9VIRU|nr:MAG: alpha/beta hydrolase fold [Edafosvirus sp.]